MTGNEKNDFAKILIGIIITIIVVIQVAGIGDRLSQKKEKDNLENSLRPLFIPLKTGDTYIPRDKDYKIKITCDLNLVSELMIGETVFLAVSKNASNDDAGIIVNKISSDCNESVLQCWKNRDTEAKKKNPNATTFQIISGEDKIVSGSLFDIKSIDGLMAGKVRLIKRGNAVYEVRCNAKSESWKKYEAVFSEMINSFVFLRM